MYYMTLPENPLVNELEVFPSRHHPRFSTLIYHLRDEQQACWWPQFRDVISPHRPNHHERLYSFHVTVRATCPALPIRLHFIILRIPREEDKLRSSSYFHDSSVILLLLQISKRN
jgi:hypothetical protein